MQPTQCYSCFWPFALDETCIYANKLTELVSTLMTSDISSTLMLKLHLAIKFSNELLSLHVYLFVPEFIIIITILIIFIALIIKLLKILGRCVLASLTRRWSCAFWGRWPRWGKKLKLFNILGCRGRCINLWLFNNLLGC
jgi:hypothetical protein